MFANVKMSESTTEAYYLHKHYVDQNVTTVDEQLKTTYKVMIPILSALIIVMNLIVVLSSGLILRRRLKPRSTYIFLGNVALADLLTGVAVIVGQYGPRNSEMICCVEIGLIISATLASVYSIGLIAIDRYFYILYGLFYNQYIPTHRARIMILGIWLLAMIVGFLPAMGVRNPIEIEHCWLILLAPTALLLSIVCIGLVPLCVTIILYGFILKNALGKISEISKQSRIHNVQKEPNRLRYFRGGSQRTEATLDQSTISNISQENVADAEVLENNKFYCCLCCRCKRKMPSVYSPSRWKAIKIVILTTGCYFITWFPYFIACALYASCEEEQLTDFCITLRIMIASPLALLGLANSLCNPIIYAWWHNGFRESAKNAYQDIWRRLRLDTYITSGLSSSMTTSTQAATTPIGVEKLDSQDLSSDGIDNCAYLETNSKMEG